MQYEAVSYSPVRLRKLFLTAFITSKLVPGEKVDCKLNDKTYSTSKVREIAFE